MPSIFRFCLLFCFLTCSLSNGYAQIADDFSDGNFNQNPGWVGDTPNFIVNAQGELQLMAPDAGTSVLAVQGNIPDSAVWLLDLRMEFAPSAANLLRIYLLADQSDLSLANGYFLEIGENGSADAIRFYRQDGAVKTLLATGTPGLVANDPVDGSLRMHRSTNGLWILEAAPGGNGFQPEFSVADATWTGGADRWLGFQCVYSATRKDKFFFDNVSVQPDLPDLTPPVLLSASASDASTVVAIFDENLDTISALNPANYSISGVGSPASVVFVPNFPNTVQLNLGSPLAASGNYTLQSNAVADLHGNASGIQTADFDYIQVEAALPFDLVINEIMADPAPSQGLPEVEWVELYNRSGKYIDLQTLTFGESGGAQNPLPPYVLAPDSLVVLCLPSAALELNAVVPHVLGITGFPSLNNLGDWVILSDQAGNVINQVAFSLDWHTDPDKKDGGWSLERINPTLPCQGKENWQSCPVPPGGTPGLPNASLQTAPDLTAPKLLSVNVEDALTLHLVFSEGLDQLSAENVSNYLINPGLTILSASFPGDSRDQVQIVLAAPLQSGIQYTLSVSSGITDCSGNAAQTTNSILFGLVENPGPDDLIFNEIMPAPSPSQGLPEIEWVELINRSGKFLQLESVTLTDASGSPKALPAYVLAPDSMLVLSSPDGAIELSALTGNALAIISFPSLNDDGDLLTLRSATGILLDRVNYSSSWHTDPNKADGGYSLERMNPDLPCLGKENWASCKAPLGGTPGRINSNFNQIADVTPPHPLSAYAPNSTTILLQFSEGMDAAAAEDIAAYQINPARQITSAAFENETTSQVRLTLDEAMQTRTIYVVTFSPDLADCSGNPVAAADTLLVGLPEKPEPQDVVINEILFNPASGGSRFVEVLNRSDKIFDLSAFTLANFRGPADIEPLVLSRLFLPGEYLVFTEHPFDIANRFPGTRPDWLLLQALPSLADDSDNISFVWSGNGQKVMVDSLDYSEDWHNALLTDSDREGVALERIRPAGPTNQGANWTSAASVQSGSPGTPTQPNSQFLDVPAAVDDKFIQLPTSRISPDDDGYEDFLDIFYQVPETGFAATLTIYDAGGLPVKHLVRQDLIGTEGSIRWDGDTDDGSRARPGIHILYAEIFAPGGEVKRVKKSFAVVAKF